MSKNRGGKNTLKFPIWPDSELKSHSSLKRNVWTVIVKLWILTLGLTGKSFQTLYE